MRKGLFTKSRGRKDLQKRRSSSDCYSVEEIKNSWSTNPSDLPKGHAVGSMTVPYPPPYYSGAAEISLRKEPKRKKKRPKSASINETPSAPAPTKKFWQRHHRNTSDTPSFEYIPITHEPNETDSPIPIEDQPTSPEHPLATAFVVEPHPNTEELDMAPPDKPPRAKTKVKGSSPKVKTKVKGSSPKAKKKDSAGLTDLRRSCSMDALDEIEDRGTSKPRSPSVRRSSFEGQSPDLRRLNHSRYINTPPTRPTRSTRLSLYRRPTKGNDSPIFKRETTAQNSLQRFLSGSRHKSVDNILELLQSGVDVNALDESTGDAVIHAILKNSKTKHKLDALLALLVNSSNVDVNLRNRRGNTALHIGVEEGEEMCIKALIVFGADINRTGSNEFTPLDLCIHNGKLDKIESLLFNLGAKSSVKIMKEAHSVTKVPRMHSFAENMAPLQPGRSLLPHDKLSDFINRYGMRRFYQELQQNVDRRFSLSTSNDGGMEEAFALVQQKKELERFNKTLRQSGGGHNTNFSLEGGSRMLFLDGGGIKGLIELEVLMQIEARTGRTILELFDWIVGTSTGGLIALVLVYGKKTLKQMQQVCFTLKDKVFSKARYGYACDSEALDEVLKEHLDPNIKMSDISYPKVLIAAVNKETTNLKLHFFNNCFGDEFCDVPVWKAARYTSAAPMYFTEIDNYVDGGVICNNPSEFGMTRIQNFFRQQGMKLPIAVVVSIGSGSYPPETIGDVNAQEALFFGKHWLKPTQLLKKTTNLLSLLTTALLESEMVAENTKSRCLEQNIPFFRFNPHLDEVVGAAETDNEKLFSMVLKTKLELDSKELDRLTHLFHQIAQASHSPIIESIAEEGAIEDDTPGNSTQKSHPHHRDNSAARHDNERFAPQATSSPDLDAEKINLNLVCASKPDPPLEQSTSVLSDIREESYQHSSSFSQASTDFLLASSPVKQQQSLSTLAPNSPNIQLQSNSSPKQSAKEEETGTVENHQVLHKEQLEAGLLQEPPTIRTHSEPESDGITPSQEFGTPKLAPGETTMIEIIRIDQQGNTIQEPEGKPLIVQVLETESPAADKSVNIEAAPIRSELPADNEASNKQSADHNGDIELEHLKVASDSDDRQTVNTTHNHDFMKTTNESNFVAADIGNPETEPVESDTYLNQSNFLSDNEELSCSSEGDSVGLDTYSEKCEQQLDSYFATKVMSVRLRVPVTPPNETLSSEVSKLMQQMEKQSNSLAKQSTITDTRNKNRQLEMNKEAKKQVECVAKSEYDSKPGTDSPPGPLEQSQTTVAFNLIERQCNQVFEELSSIKATPVQYPLHEVPPDTSPQPPEIPPSTDRDTSPPFSGKSEPLRADPKSSRSTYDTLEPLPHTSVHQTSSKPTQNASTSIDSKREPLKSKHKKPHPIYDMLEPLPPTSTPETTPSPREYSSPETNQAVYPDSTKFSSPKNDFCASPNSDDTEVTFPQAIEHNQYIIDRVGELTMGDEKQEFVLSYQTFSKQYKVGDTSSEDSKKSKAAKYKLQTKKTKTSHKQETTI